jgi:probable F420-dependent oxidoreductase
MTRYGITLPSLNNTHPELTRCAKDAEDAGFDTVVHWQGCRNPFIGMAASAAVTERISLASGIAEAFGQTPFVLANTAADLDEVSNGRTILGLGVGDPGLIPTFHGLHVPSPRGQVVEAIEAVRLVWDHLATGRSHRFSGRFYQLELEANPFISRSMVRESVPIYLAAIGPRMLQTAGEIADGVIGALWSPHYLKSFVMPNIEAGAARAGRSLASIDITSETVCSVSHDRAEALRRGRIQVGFYAVHPASDRIIRGCGFEAERERIREALSREGFAALDDDRLVSDEMLAELSITGTPDECRRQLAELESVLPHIWLHTPYAPPLTAEESADALHMILQTFGS